VQAQRQRSRALYDVDYCPFVVPGSIRLSAMALRLERQRGPVAVFVIPLVVEFGSQGTYEPVCYNIAYVLELLRFSLVLSFRHLC